MPKPIYFRLIDPPLVAPMRCVECGELMVTRIGRWRFVESGLTNVYLDGVPIFKCDEHGEAPAIYSMSGLHNEIARELAIKDKLTNQEMIFLKKWVTCQVLAKDQKWERCNASIDTGDLSAERNTGE